MTTWKRYRTGTVHAFDMPLHLYGQEVQSLCFKAKIRADNHYNEPRDRITSCVACVKKLGSMPQASGDVDL